jgi:predicted lactoylglutathione lyase
MVTRTDAPHKEDTVSRHIAISLPVADLPQSIAFFKALGFSPNPQFSDATAACIDISETIMLVLLTHARFRGFTPKSICDTRSCAEVSLTLSCDSRAQVDDLAARAAAAGGSSDGKAEDYGFMYQRGFADPDGHEWGLSYMSAAPPQEQR